MVCCFLGHRKIEYSSELENKISETIEDLIINCGVRTFLIGSNSEFITLCHKVVTEKKRQYPNINRIAYTCKSETCVLEKERSEKEELYLFVHKKKANLLGVESEVDYKTKYVSGRASYIERNNAMIDASDYCLFYYDDNYKPAQKKYSKRSVSYYQPNSGTKLAFEYAVKKSKKIINIFSRSE